MNWSSILLDGYKKLRLPRQPSCEALLMRRPKSVKTIDSTVRLQLPGVDTGKGYKYRFLFIFFLIACFTSVLVCITNYILTMCKLLLVSMSVWQCSFF